jgi:hypothetical protein
MIRNIIFFIMIGLPLTLFGQMNAEKYQKLYDDVKQTDTLINKDEYDLSVQLDRDMRGNEGVTKTERTLHYYHVLNDYLKIVVTQSIHGKVEVVKNFYFSPQKNLVVSEIEHTNFSRHIYVYEEDNPVMAANLVWNPETMNYSEIEFKKLSAEMESEGDNLLRNAVSYYDVASAFIDDMPAE